MKIYEIFTCDDAGFGRLNIRILGVLIAALVTASGCSGTSSSNTPLAAFSGVMIEDRPTGVVYVDPKVDFDRVNNIDEIGPDDVIKRSKRRVRRSGEVYLMRGLADVFSRGIDRMAKDMRGRGFDAVNFSYKHWRPVADNIVARNGRKKVSYPIIIMGHSLGANESSKFANYLASRGVRVSLVVAFDPVETGHVGKQIGEVINYYLPKKRADNRILAQDGFDGKLENIDVTVDDAITHTNVEKNAEFQSNSIGKALALTKVKKSRAVANTEVDDSFVQR